MSWKARIPKLPRSLSWSPLSVTFAFFLLVLALRVYLGRFDSLYEDHTIFGGVTYTEAHVMLPGLLFICAALVLGAGIAVANAFLLSPRTLATGRHCSRRILLYRSANHWMVRSELYRQAQ